MWFFFQGIYSVHVPRLPPDTLQTIPDFRTASNSDAAASQIPENRTYEIPFQQQASPTSSSPPESLASIGKSKI